ncbi:MAG: tRNA pseudouridine(55) synthase TruB [Pseudomonadota bacterium]
MGRRRKGLPISGWLNFHKPIGMTSTQAVGKARWLLGAQKAGHGGTLDPLASGVLPIAFGEATKVLPFLVHDRKAYRFEVTWGRSTTTDDLEGETLETSDARPMPADLSEALKSFVGTIEQTPPAFSAIKVNGKRAYALARAGETVALKSRPVEIHALKIVSCQAHSALIDVRCGKGTYIRSLARDLAKQLGTQGHVTRLERCRVGPFALQDAISLEKLESSRHKPGLLLALETVLDDIPALAVSGEAAQKIKHGQAIEIDEQCDGDVLLTVDGYALALAQVTGILAQPRRVFHLSSNDMNHEGDS